MENRSDTSASWSNSTTWTTLPGSQVSVGIYALSTRLINARFTAESSCVGSGGAICRVRLIALRDNGVVYELAPVSGDEFAFDSVDNTNTKSVEEGQAMERSRRLPQGNYQVLVQYSVSSLGASFQLDDWHFAVESST